jgi:mono/diheme cytochrome c family protein
MLKPLQRIVRGGAALGALLALAACARSPEQLAADNKAAIERYCTECHSAAEQEAGLSLEDADVAHAGAKPEIWEKVVHKLDVGLMPPPGEPRPDARTVAGLAAYLKTSLDTAAATAPKPGRSPLHRLSRTEYGNAVRDLLGLPVDVESLLPADSSSHGFDNVSDVLKTSPLLLERYLTVGLRVAATALGDPALEPRATHYAPPADLSQNRWIEGLPLGTRGGLIVEHYFPSDAEYDFRPELWEAAASTVRGLEGFKTPFQYEMLLDGVPVHRADLGGVDDDALSNRDQGSATASAQDRIRTRLPVTAGMHRVGFTFVMKSFAIEQRVLQPFKSDLPPGNDAYGWPRISNVLITGPYAAKGVGDTPVRRAVLTCQPGPGLTDVDCAEQILGRLARRAYSRSVTEADVTTLLDFYRQGSAGGRGFERGIQLGLARILSGPEFLFRGTARADAAPAAVYRVDDVTLASRLALFLWSSIPDDELLDAANAGKLRDPKMLEAQVKRMLADARAQALVANFADQWLQLRNIAAKAPDLLTFPDWDDNLRKDMLRETQLLLDSVLLGDASVVRLIDADYTFLNERLAAHYGIDGVFGDAFRRVQLMDPNRRGLLGQGSILFETSVATRTSPVFRGKWIMTNVFNSPPNPPPPNVPALEDNAAGAAPHTVRERLERHRQDPVCAACHVNMDPAGFALENFDAVGRWRDADGAQPVDASGGLPGGIAIAGPAGLREAIVRRPELFVDTVTQKLMIYALARGLEPEDMPAVRAVVRDAARADYRFSALVLGIVRSVPFQMKQQPAESGATVAALGSPAAAN